LLSAKILVIDDEESIRHTFSAFLSKEGYQVVTARDYKTAMDLVSNTSFDLIISDIILGSFSGVDILREIKTLNINTPVVMITGEPNIDTAAASLRFGAFDYLPKPIRKETLIRVAKHALQHKAILDEKMIIESEKEQFRSHLEAIFRSVEDAIITVDHEMHIIQANDATERICGISPKSIKWDLGNNNCCRKCLNVLKETLTKKRPIREYRIECENEHREQQVVELTISPLKGGEEESIGAVMVIRDITRLSHLERELQERNQFHNIVGRCKRMQEIYSLLENLKDIDTTVLITGPSGTGKELVARAIHYNGQRAHMPFVVVNCSALAENLLESELFGHVKGSFTGAVRDKEGRFQLADRGTIFLDEIGDISPNIQLKLLRVLENKEIERVGDATPIKLDVQVISATNADLKEKIRRGEFREDLYYRLKVVVIDLPPLSERRDDILLIVDHYLSIFKKRFRKDIKSISSDVERLFMEYTWPGNVRELIHTLEHAFIVCCSDTIELTDLPPEIRNSHKINLPSEKSPINERDRIVEALNQTGWNKAKAAKILKVSRQTIYRKITEHSINTPDIKM
jgi:PAS domain S-box-containing protein